MKKISCIIPVHNEEQSIAKTLQVVLALKSELHEIIVVDDGSKDRTREIINQFSGFRFLINDRNLGKSGTIAKGIKESTGDYVLFLDADLVDLRPNDVSNLIEPIEKDLADVVISMRKNTPGWMKLLGVDSMSGERVLPRSVLIQRTDEISRVKSYGLEVFLNRLIIKNKLSVKTVFMPDVANLMKWHKRGYWHGIKHEILMWVDLFKTVSFFEFMTQQFELRKRLVKN